MYKRQPHFKAQDPDTTIFWGYGLYTDNVGDYVKKPMSCLLYTSSGTFCGNLCALWVQGRGDHQRG